MSRPWRPVEAVLSATEALQLRHETEAELGSEAFRRKVVKAMQAAELCYKGEAFLLPLRERKSLHILNLIIFIIFINLKLFYIILF